MKRNSRYYLEDLTNDDGRKWKRLLEYALHRGDTVEFTVPTKEEEWSPRLEPLLPFLVERWSSHWRWQAKQKQVQTFLRFSLVPSVEALLCTPHTLQETLFMQPAFPEDPAFYVNGQAILWTISHEVWAYLLLTEEEAKNWRAQGFRLDVSYEAEPPSKRIS